METLSPKKWQALSKNGRNGEIVGWWGKCRSVQKSILGRRVYLADKQCTAVPPGQVPPTTKWPNVDNYSNCPLGFQLLFIQQIVNSHALLTTYRNFVARTVAPSVCSIKLKPFPLSYKIPSSLKHPQWPTIAGSITENMQILTVVSSCFSRVQSIYPPHKILCMHNQPVSKFTLCNTRVENLEGGKCCL